MTGGGDHLVRASIGLEGRRNESGSQRLGEYQQVVDILSEPYPELVGDKPVVNDFTVWPAVMLAHAYMRLERAEEGNRLLDVVGEHVSRMRKMQGSGWVTGVEDVQIHALRGETEQALDALEAAVDSGWLFYAQAFLDNPNLDNIRDTERFKELYGRVRDKVATEREWYYSNPDAPLY